MKSGKSYMNKPLCKNLPNTERSNCHVVKFSVITTEGKIYGSVHEKNSFRENGLKIFNVTEIFRCK